MASQANLQEIKGLAEHPESCIKVSEQRVTLMLHPVYSQQIKKGIIVELDAMLNRYSAMLGGLPLAYDSPKLVSSHGWLFHTNPFNHILVSARFYVFAPEIGSVVHGVVKKKSQNHLGCLVHGKFNVSVPRPWDDGKNGQAWLGGEIEEGDAVYLKLVEIRLGFYLPFFKAELDVERTKEALTARQVETVETGKHVTFNDDSGISSNEADDSMLGGKKKKLKSEEGEEYDEEKPSVSYIKEEEVDGISEGKKKKKKKKKDTEIDLDLKEEEVSLEIEDTPKHKKKKKKYTEIDLDLKEEEVSLEAEEDSPKHKKKKKKKEYESLDISNIKKEESFDITKEENLINDSPRKKKKRKGIVKEVGEEIVEEKGRRLEEEEEEIKEKVGKKKRKRIDEEVVQEKTQKKRKRQEEEEFEEEEERPKKKKKKGSK